MLVFSFLSLSVARHQLSQPIRCLAAHTRSVLIKACTSNYPGVNVGVCARQRPGRGRSLPKAGDPCRGRRGQPCSGTLLYQKGLPFPYTQLYCKHCGSFENQGYGFLPWPIDLDSVCKTSLAAQGKLQGIPHVAQARFYTSQKFWICVRESHPSTAFCCPGVAFSHPKPEFLDGVEWQASRFLPTLALLQAGRARSDNINLRSRRFWQLAINVQLR
eukprot:g49565.t1